MRSLRMFALLLVMSMGAWIIPQETFAQRSSAGFRLFYDELSPYGSWVDYQNYGYVWMPNIDSDFSPYVTDGRWVYTEDGWTWFSDYPWGWATFHYGRWDYDDVYGWFWVPDDEWGPAWVSWRRSPGYFGWAPLRPGISLSIAFGRDYRERNERWTFVRDRDFGSPDMDHRYLSRDRNTSYMNNSTVIVNSQRDDRRNATYVTGPDRNDVQRVTHAAVTPVAIRETDQPGHSLSNGELQIYRPQIQKRNGNEQNPAPARVSRLTDMRPASERNSRGRQQQPPTIAPPVQSQPVPPQAVSPGFGRGRQQRPPTVNPPASVQPPQQPAVSRSDRRGMQRQPAPVKVQPVQQQPPAAVSSDRGRSPQPLNLDSSRGRGKQTQNVPQPKKVDRIEPTKNQQEKEKPDEKPKQREQ